MRKECTRENPSDGTPYRWYHPDAVSTGRSYDAFRSDEDSWDEYKCPHCGIVFKETIPK
jgi:hypothetical protein